MVVGAYYGSVEGSTGEKDNAVAVCILIECKRQKFSAFTFRNFLGKLNPVVIINPNPNKSSDN